MHTHARLYTTQYMGGGSVIARVGAQAMVWVYQGLDAFALWRDKRRSQ